MIKLYDSQVSSNCYKLRLLLHQLAIPYTRVAVDLLGHETRTPEFLARHPLGYLPVLELESGVTLVESNAIAWYLADGSHLVPEDRVARARVLQWMFFEQNNVEPAIGRARAWVGFFGVPPGREAELAATQARGHAALGQLEAHLDKQPFVTGDTYTIADLALYANIHRAPEGGVALDRYPVVLGWLDRVRQQPGHIAMTDEPRPTSPRSTSVRSPSP